MATVSHPFSLCPHLLYPSPLTVIQDLTLVAALGFGFLSSSFRRHGWSSVAFSFFMLALGVQGTILLDYFLNWVLDWNMIKNPFR